MSRCDGGGVLKVFFLQGRWMQLSRYINSIVKYLFEYKKMSLFYYTLLICHVTVSLEFCMTGC